MPRYKLNTKHSAQRTKDRLGISKKLSDKNAQKALDFGVTHAETTGSLNRYLTSLYFARENANNMRVYHRNVYLFHASTLITIIPLPKKYYDIADKLQKRKEQGVVAEVNPEAEETAGE